MSSFSHFSRSMALPSTRVQSSWNEGAASCGLCKIRFGSRVGLDSIASAASSPSKRAMCFGHSFAKVRCAVAAPGFCAAVAASRWCLRCFISSDEDLAVADRLEAVPRAREVTCACRSCHGLFLRFGHGLRMSLQLPQGVERAQGRARQGPVGWWWTFWGLIFLETPTLASSCNVNARF